MAAVARRGCDGVAVAAGDDAPSTARFTVWRNSSMTNGLLTNPANVAARLRRGRPPRASASAAVSALKITTGRLGCPRRIAAASSHVRLSPLDLSSPSRITHRGCHRSTAAPMSAWSAMVTGRYPA
ncbi:MAG TPA: hypothetical protein DCP25_08490 [Chloroflexi bacterium]|nr:hypothetical protein [Chloroflexota bacterium]